MEKLQKSFEQRHCISELFCKKIPLVGVGVKSLCSCPSLDQTVTHAQHAFSVRPREITSPNKFFKTLSLLTIWVYSNPTMPETLGEANLRKTYL